MGSGYSVTLQNNTQHVKSIGLGGGWFNSIPPIAPGVSTIEFVDRAEYDRFAKAWSTPTVYSWSRTGQLVMKSFTSGGQEYEGELPEPEQPGSIHVMRQLLGNDQPAGDEVERAFQNTSAHIIGIGIGESAIIPVPPTIGAETVRFALAPHEVELLDKAATTFTVAGWVESGELVLVAPPAPPEPPPEGT